MRFRILAAILICLAALPFVSRAQTVTPVAPAPQPGQAAPVSTAAELDQLLAPIALYPDQLLGQILMAATYPLEVVEAARWLAVPQNAALRGDALANALASMDWDPSVKSLVPFPQVLKMMSARLDWLQRLGDAFLGQQADVMDSVQRLRRAAQAAGTLQSTQQQTVTPVGPDIVIQPVNPQVVYVPYYNPTYVYGAWPYPGYPPFYFTAPPGYAVGAGLSFGIGIGIVSAFWGWDHWDWRERRMHVDVDRYNRIDRDRHPIRNDTWEHDPYHRRGVAYRAPTERARVEQHPAGPPEARQEYRGRVENAPARPAPPAVQRQAAPAYESYGRGADVRVQSQRGRESRATMPQAAPRPGGAHPQSSGPPRQGPQPGGAHPVDRGPQQGRQH
jgi:hypothetical protein